ncbi:hypothetical protein J4Q44_G00300000 [Coregonus suidteri]|uniref:CIDE-N domain-containing protein n=1 Tax=Coregonus suidteri TaxID=861788 RepID=A0AAN8KYM8_9TELE
MASLSINSSVEYAKTLLPDSWVRSVSTVRTTISHWILPPPQPRPFRLCTQSRRQRKGLIAASLDDLLDQVLPSSIQPRRNGICKLVFDLYKLNPKDFIGCLTIKVSLYEIYTLSYDFQCTRAKIILKSLLRCLTYVARVAGQLLLCGSSYILQYIGDDDYKGMTKVQGPVLSALKCTR